MNNQQDVMEEISSTKLRTLRGKQKIAIRLVLHVFTGPMIGRWTSVPEYPVTTC